MLKKILVGTLLAAFVGVLIFGAMNRTLDKTAQVANASEHGQGRGRSLDEAEAGGQGYGRNRSLEEAVTRAQGFGNGASSDGVAEAGGRGLGSERRGEVERQYPNYDAVPGTWETYEGTIVQVPEPGVEFVIETLEGEELVIGTGPMDLAAEGFALQIREPVQVSGYWEADEFKASQITSLATGQTFALRDEYGRPAWAGQRRSTQQIDAGGVSEAQVQEWIEIDGSVVTADTAALVLVTSESAEIEITGRPWRFAQELGFWANVGDELTLTGFIEGDEFEVGTISNAYQQTAVLRDENGRPRWAGGGRRGG